MKRKQCCNKFNKDFKSGPHQKKKKSKKNFVVRFFIVSLSLIMQLFEVMNFPLQF